MKNKGFIYRSFLLVFIFISCDDNKVETTVEEDQNVQVILDTDHGSMAIELYNETPLHRDNFINLVRNHAYDSLLFHRVIDQFMIQAGDPDSRRAGVSDTLGNGDVPYEVAAEFHPDLFHKKGVIAAARDDNPQRASSGMQFYLVQGKVFNDSTLDLAQQRINKMQAVAYFKSKQEREPMLDSFVEAQRNGDFEAYRKWQEQLHELALTQTDFKSYRIPDNQREVYTTLGGTPHLDQSYTVFGEVIEGLEVIDSIAKTPTNSLNRPLKDIHILRMEIVE
jgi:cyclophilin family peptidyl-prolyl cis-trans isomerase